MTIIGIAGPLGSGRGDLHPVLTAWDFAVIDLDAIAARSRCEDPIVRAAYKRYGLLGSIRQDGDRTGEYYRRVVTSPQPHADVTAIEIQVVAKMIPAIMQQEAAANIALSGSCLHLMLPHLPPLDHVVLCLPPVGVWYGRLRRWAQATEIQQDPDSTWLSQLVRNMGIDQPGIMARVAEHIGLSKSLILIDTSHEDGGAADLWRLLAPG